MADIIARTIQLAHTRNIQSVLVSQDSEVKVSVSRPPSTANLFIDSNDRADSLIATWDSLVVYPIFALAYYDGVIYYPIGTTQGGSPPPSNGNWTTIPAYDSGTSAVLGQPVIYNGVLYTSLQNANLNHQPDISPTWWLPVRTLTNSTDFSISKRNNILTGYFTRLGVVEMILDWCIPNISPYSANNTITFTITGGDPHTITLPTGHYTTAQCLDTMVVLMNDAADNSFQIVENINTGRITIEGADDFVFSETLLNNQLNIRNPDTPSKIFQVGCPKIIPFIFVDFVCPQLTYPQDVKDGSTALLDNNVIYRWYLSWDNQPDLDKYGFPIFQGYTPFVQRRYLPFPKQIKWDANLPIGQLNFQVLDDNGNILPTGRSGNPYEGQLSADQELGELEFQMTLLVSEN